MNEKVEKQPNTPAPQQIQTNSWVKSYKAPGGNVRAAAGGPVVMVDGRAMAPAAQPDPETNRVFTFAGGATEALDAWHQFCDQSQALHSLRDRVAGEIPEHGEGVLTVTGLPHDEESWKVNFATKQDNGGDYGAQEPAEHEPAQRRRRKTNVQEATQDAPETPPENS